MFDLSKFDRKKYDEFLDRGLSQGQGSPNGQMCIEAAICQTMGLPHGDDPGCVSAAVRSFKINLNDSPWSSPAARAKGLYDLGIAQLGSLGVVDDAEFSKRMAEKTIRFVIPKLFRQLFTGNAKLEEAAIRGEQDGTEAAATPDSFLILSAQLALETLRELNSPGVELL